MTTYRKALVAFLLPVELMLSMSSTNCNIQEWPATGARTSVCKSDSLVAGAYSLFETLSARNHPPVAVVTLVLHSSCRWALLAVQNHR